MDDKWKIVFKEHARAPIYSVNHYVTYLRRFVWDTADSSTCQRHGSRGSPDDKSRPRPEDGINPLSYFLRKLMLDLKVSYDSFVSDFVRPPNDGLGLLLLLLGNLQNSGTPGRSRPSSGRSMSKLEDYKRIMTDERDCLLCIKFTLRLKNSVSQLVEDVEGLQRIAAGVTGPNSKARITCLEILTLVLMECHAADKVVEAFTIMRLRLGESVRFKMLVSMLHTKGPSQVLFQVSCMKMFNTLLAVCPSATWRVYLQQEIISAGLDLQLLSQCAQGDGLEYDDLKREIQEWNRQYIDVDLLLTRLKNGHRDVLGEFFSGPEGPIQVSSPRQSQRDFTRPPTSFLHTGSGFTKEYRNSESDIFYNGGMFSDWQNHNPSHNIDEHLNDFEDSGSEIVSVSAQQTPNRSRKHPPNIRLSSSDPHLTGNRPSFCVGTTAITDQNLGHLLTLNTGRNTYTEEFLDAESPTETVVDAYGLVMHRKQDGDRELRNQEGTTEFSGGLYSNWKFGYFSAPYATSAQTPDANEGRELEVLVDDADDDVTKGTADGYDSGVYLHYDDRTQAKNNPADRRDWDEQCYPPNHCPVGLSRARREGIEPPVDLLHAPTSHLLVQNNSRKTEPSCLSTPAPDYTPSASLAGSVRSLNTEVARVLQDFERTLRAHDQSHPTSTRPSTIAIETVAYI